MATQNETVAAQVESRLRRLALAWGLTREQTQAVLDGETALLSIFVRTAEQHPHRAELVDLGARVALEAAGYESPLAKLARMQGRVPAARRPQHTQAKAG